MSERFPSQYLTRIFPHSTFKYQEHKKNVENFKQFLTSISFTFSVTRFSETWLDDLKFSGNASYELVNYTSKHQVRDVIKTVMSLFMFIIP